MIPIEQLERRFEVVQGKREPKKNDTAVLLHAHLTTLDVAGSVNSMVDAAAAAGVDELGVTDHDTTRGLELVQARIDKKGYAMRMSPGIEVTAVHDDDVTQERHVLVYGADEMPPPGLSVADVNRWAHGLCNDTREVYTTVAHPGHWDNSLKGDELQRIQKLDDPDARFDFGEVYNGMNKILDLTFARYPRSTEFFKRRGVFLDPGANDTARTVLSEYNRWAEEDTVTRHRLPFIGGADMHAKSQIPGVLNLVPQGMNVFEAARQGELVVVRDTQLRGLPVWQIAVHVGLGEVMVRRQRKKAERAIFQRNGSQLPQ